MNFLTCQELKSQYNPDTGRGNCALQAAEKLNCIWAENYHMKKGVSCKDCPNCASEGIYNKIFPKTAFCY